MGSSVVHKILSMTYFKSVLTSHEVALYICFYVAEKIRVPNISGRVSMGGNVHRILLQNEPIFTKRQENTHNEGKQIWNFSYLILFSVLGRCF